MKDGEEPGPSSALLHPQTAAAKTHSKHTRIPKPGKKGKSSPRKDNVVTVTEMKEVSPKGSPATTPSSSSSYVIENSDSKRVVYSIFPPIHDTIMFGLTKRQLLTLVTLALTEFFGGMVYSIQAPFFPGEAVGKLLASYPHGQIGCVFGVFELAVFAFIPVFGKMMQHNGTPPKLIFHLGVFMSAVSTIIFAFVEYIQQPYLYLASALVIRAVQGVGEAGILISACALLTIDFPNSVATTFTSMETFYCLGLIAGPVMGGTMMEIYSPDESGRFFITFMLNGCFFLGIAIVDVFLLPSNDNPDSFHELDGKCCFNNGGYKVFHLFRARSIPLVALTILSAGVSMGFLNPVLAPHIQEFLVGRSAVLVGAFFIIAAGLGGLLAPAINCFINNLARSQRYFVIFGSIAISAGFLLVGPAPFFTLEKSLLLTGIGLCLVGLGLASITVASFKLLLSEAINNGYADNINSYGLVLTFWTMTFCLGSFIGSCASGFLFDLIGFSMATWAVFGMHILVILLNSATIVLNWRERAKYRDSVFEDVQEDEPLLGSPYKSNARSLRTYS